MNTIAGARVRACSTGPGPGPPQAANISTKPEPDTDKKGTRGLAGDRAGEQGLAGARWPRHQHAARAAGPGPVIAAGVAQIVDDLADLGLTVVYPATSVTG